jgi:hypothetical protein
MMMMNNENIYSHGRGKICKYEHSSSKNRGFHKGFQTQNCDVLESSYEDFDKVSVLYGNHYPK